MVEGGMTSSALMNSALKKSAFKQSTSFAKLKGGQMGVGSSS